MFFCGCFYFLLLCTMDEPTSQDLPLRSFLLALPPRIHQNSGRPGCAIAHTAGKWQRSSSRLTGPSFGGVRQHSCRSCRGSASVALLPISVMSTLIHDPGFPNSDLCSYLTAPSMELKTELIRFYLGSF